MPIWCIIIFLKVVQEGTDLFSSLESDSDKKDRYTKQ